MKVSFTGTFSVSKNELGKKIHKVEVKVSVVMDVYKDWVSLSNDEGEWDTEEIKCFLKNQKSYKDIFTEGLCIKISPADEEKFWKSIRRLAFLDYIDQEYCDNIGFSVALEQLVSSDEDFFGEAIGLDFCQGDEEEKTEFFEKMDVDPEWGKIKELFELTT